MQDDNLITWVYYGEHTVCTVRIAREMLRTTYPDWSDERIERELFVRVLVDGRGWRRGSVPPTGRPTSCDPGASLSCAGPGRSSATSMLPTSAAPRMRPLSSSS